MADHTPDHLAAREYVSEFATACDQAMRAAGATVVDLDVAGVAVRLRFAGPALVPSLLPALEHLRAGTTGTTDEPALTIELWDAASTGVFPPRFPWRGEEGGLGGEVRGYTRAGIHALFQSGAGSGDGDFMAVTIFDEEASVARYFVIAPNGVPWYERAAPLRAALYWGLRGPDRLLVHAGAVGIDGRGVLLAGPSGSGKSTTAVAALLAGHDYLGDDYVLVDLGGPQPAAHALYATAKLGRTATALLPGLPASFGAPARREDEKQALAVRELRPNGLSRRVDIAAIVLPRFGPGARTRLRPASASTALLALAPSTIFQAPSANGAALHQLAELTRLVPAHVLELGDGTRQIATILSQLLNGEAPP